MTSDAEPHVRAAAIDPAHGVGVELSIVMPCLNEAQTLAACVGKALGFLARTGIHGEVVVADNGSTDGSQDLARSLGARVVDVTERGYGNALIAGIRSARGRFVIMGDSDDSYDFSRLDLFVDALRDGADLVMGNRFAGGIMPGAMPPLHRYLGNPVLSSIGRVLFRSPCKDFHCGLRGFNRAAILSLHLSAPGMEFASEMVVKATIKRLRIEEVPTILSPDGRNRPPHLRSWRDGWRHLKFLMLYSPRGLFLYPGMILVCIGGLLGVRLLAGPIMIGRVGLDINTLLYAASMVEVGWLLMLFWVCAKVHGISEGVLPPDPRFARALEICTLERSLLASLALFVVGLLLAIGSVIGWGHENFTSLNPSSSMRLVIPAVTAVLLSAETATCMLLVTFLNIRRD